MASGKLGSADLSAGVLTQLYAGPPGGSVATVNIAFVNRSGSPTTVRVAVSNSSTAGSVANGDYVVYDRVLNGNDEYERTGLVLSAGEFIWVEAAATGISVRAHGMEGSV